ncbi:MAG TPA: serine hydrolase [Labilithrix sp.]|nr:serine hydrolase [Labilithrix sp.]
MQDAIAKVGASCNFGLRCAIAVRDLVTNARAGYQDNALFVSASSAKAIWVGAALHDRSIADVEPHVKPIFEKSDNIESGAVIDLLSSPDRVNTFQWQDGKLADIGFCKWNYGTDRIAKNCPSVMNGENFFSASDAVSYLAQIWDRSLLGADKSKALLSWMTLSPRQGYGGWLGTQLPSAARASMRHKAGWRPPGSVAGYSNSNANEMGIVEVPGGHAYAVAILIDGAQSQDAYDNEALPLLEYLSCVAYHAVAGDSASACSAP